MEMESVRPVS
jgi:hypothetical protein